MGGLVAYASSDEEDEVQEAVLPLKTESSKKGTTPAHHPETNDVKPAQPPPTTADPETQSLPDSVTIGPVQQHSVPLGPSLPPMDPQPLQGNSQDGDLSQPPTSPYTASRALLRDLTLPPVPNFDIPASPPGSPPAALEAKLSQFLDLKKKGVHFNAKLTQSAALRNPSLTDKLMGFVDLDGRAGYVTTLSPDLWNPLSEEVLPEWATRAALRQSQERVRAERAGLRKGGGPVEFVPAAIAGGGDVGSPATTEQSELLRAGKRKTGAF